MVQMEEGKKNGTENVNNVPISNENVDEEFHPEVVIPEIHLPQDQNSENIDDISTIQDSKYICQRIIAEIIEEITAQEVDSGVLCQSILLDIVEKIDKRRHDPEDVPDNQIFNSNQSPDNEIIQIHVHGK